MTDQPPIRIVLVDDHEIVRAGLRRLLEDEPAWTVEAEAGDVDHALRAVLRHQPDLLVLDLNLAGVSSLGFIPDFLDRSPSTRIVVLTMESDPAYAQEAMRAGASAFVLKDAAEEELVDAIELALVGHTYLDPTMGAMIATQRFGSAEPARLTRREEEILRLLAYGHTNGEIADQLFLSRRTIETHRANLQRKLQLASRAELTRYALDHHLLQV